MSGGCCWGGAFVGGLFVGSVLAAPYYAYPSYAYPYAAYPVYSDPVYSDPVYAPAPVYQPQTQVYVAPAVQREVCYVGGCYQLQGDGVTVAYSWIWVPAALAPHTRASRAPARTPLSDSACEASLFLPAQPDTQPPLGCRIWPVR